MNIEELNDDKRVIKGVSISTTTLLGVVTKKYPVSHGNCFSMVADNGKSYNIVNFVCENLEEAIRREKLTLPVTLHILGDVDNSKTAIMYDERIPTQWYSNKFCSVCTPVHLLPTCQLIERGLDIKSGRLRVNGAISVYSIGRGPDFRTEEEKEEANAKVITSKYIPQTGKQLEP